MKYNITDLATFRYFQNEYVNKRKWLDQDTYTQIIELCQFLPGPASSQVGMAIGMIRGGLLGGVLSFRVYRTVYPFFDIICLFILSVSFQRYGVDTRVKTSGCCNSSTSCL